MNRTLETGKNASDGGTFLFLALSIISVWSASRVWFLAIPSLLFALSVFRHRLQGDIPRLRRLWLYLGVVPFGIWFAAYPNPPRGFFPLFFYIPAWYLIYLALLEWRSSGRGGRPVFVWFSALAAVFLSLFDWTFVRDIFWNSLRIASAVSAIVVFVFIACLWKNRKDFLFFIVGVLSAFLGNQIMNLHGGFHFGNRSSDYYGTSNLMGFGNVGKLGSFSENYSGDRENEVVLRIYSPWMPNRFKGIAYARYLPGVGLWKKSPASRTLYAGRYVGDYAGFGTGGLRSDSVPVWVRSSLPFKEVVFAPLGAAGVAVKDVDSLRFCDGGFFEKEGDSPRDWFYWEGVARPRDTVASPTDSLWLSVPESLYAFLDSVSTEIGLYPSPDSVNSNLGKIDFFFMNEFSYSLQVPVSRKEDPLRTFVRTRKGFCEYFASLSVLLLRRSGVPARYVTGFAYPTPGDGYWIFRRKSAHAWAEYRNAAGRWGSFDPPGGSDPAMLAPAPFPSRILESVQGKAFLLRHRLSDGAWRASLDAFGNATNRILESGLVRLAGGALVVLFVIWRIVRKRRPGHRSKKIRISRRTARLRRLLSLAEKKLGKRGFVREPGETVAAFLLRVPESPETKKGKKILSLYESWRWKPI